MPMTTTTTSTRITRMISIKATHIRITFSSVISQEVAINAIPCRVAGTRITCKVVHLVVVAEEEAALAVIVGTSTIVEAFLVVVAVVTEEEEVNVEEAKAVVIISSIRLVIVTIRISTTITHSNSRTGTSVLGALI